MNSIWITQAQDLFRFIDLQHQQAALDPYIIPISDEKEKAIVLEQLHQQKRVIVLFSQAGKDIGFINIIIENTTMNIESLFYYPDTITTADLSQIISSLQERFPQRAFKYITPMSKQVQLLHSLGFTCQCEHIQMEKVINETNISSQSLQWVAVTKQRDLQLVWQLMNKAMTHTDYRYTRDELCEVAANPDKQILLGYNNHLPVAFLIYEVNKRRNQQENLQVLYIEELGVHPNARGQGYGQATLTQAEVITRQADLKVLRLHVFSDNLPAYRLYIKNGFQEIKSIGHFRKL